MDRSLDIVLETDYADPPAGLWAELVDRVRRRIETARHRRRFGFFAPDAYIEPHVELLQPSAISVGSNSMIRHHSRLEVVLRSDTPRLLIGNDVVVSPFCHIGAAQSIVIEDHVGIAAYVLITDHEHDFRDPTLGYRGQQVVARPVIIGEHAFLGERATVLKGVTVGDHAIVGAASVVTRDVPPYTIVAGLPARPVKRWDFEHKRWRRVAADEKYDWNRGRWVTVRLPTPA